MVHESVARCIQVALPKLDPSKEPFSYLTTTIRNVFLSKIHKEKKFWSVKRKIYEELTGKECNWKDGLRSEDEQDKKEFEEYEEDTDEDFCSPSSREHSLEAEGDLDSTGSGETEEEDSDFD